MSRVVRSRVLPRGAEILLINDVVRLGGAISVLWMMRGDVTDWSKYDGGLSEFELFFGSISGRRNRSLTRGLSLLILDALYGGRGLSDLTKSRV